MKRWIAPLALLALVGCNPNNDNNWRLGGNTSDTGPEDSDTVPVGDCLPTLGSPTAEIDDYPPDWVIEVTVDFQEGSCSIDQGELYLEVESGGELLGEMGPLDIELKTGSVLVDDYDSEAGTGYLIFAVTVTDEDASYKVSFWLDFDGQSTDTLTASVN